MKTSRYTVDLDPAFDSTLTALASDKGVSKAEIIKRALATYNYLSTQAPMSSNMKVSITDSADKVLKDVVLP